MSNHLPHAAGDRFKPYTVGGLVVELTHLVGELNHQLTRLAELCKPRTGGRQGGDGVKSSALPTRVGVVAGGLPKKVRSIGSANQDNI